MFLKNLSKLLEDPRKRSVILVTFLLLLTMIFVGGIRLLNRARNSGLPTHARIESMHGMHSVNRGGTKGTPKAYAQLQKEYNKKKAQEAQKSGRSSLATIVDSFSLEGNESSVQKKETALPTLMSDNEQAIVNHKAFMAHQQTRLTRQQMQNAMQQQMSQLFNTWNRSPTQVNEVSAIDKDAFLRQHQGVEYHGPILVKAGSILQAVLLSEINSDEPSPVLAKITSGAFKEGRLIGTLSRTGERLLIQFHTLSLPNQSKTLSIQAVGVDANTSRTSLASHVDRHLLLRYSSLASGAFLQGVGMKLHSLAFQSQKPDALLADQVKSIASGATGRVSTQYGSELTQQVNIPPTVCVHAGTCMGILFTNDLPDTSSKG